MTGAGQQLREKMSEKKKFKSINEYIETFPKKIQDILGYRKRIGFEDIEL